ncbi:MAG: hypothetical protein J7M10_09155 [Candidatus Cloacimonetes bacterium]|nr:hypothetical protein [Candidatus Cloacimonadota bacterium]
MKKYIKALLGIILLASTMMLTNCDSPLSDEPLNDPSKISPTLTVERTYDNSKTLKGESIAHLFDKNLNLVRIKDGGVYVNGTALTLEYYITGGPYYETTGDYPIHQNTQYTITVKMSNGDEYDSVIETQSQDLHTFNIPATFNHTDDIQVTWAEIIPDDDVWIEFSYEDQSGSGVQMAYVPDDSVGTGSYTIPSEIFSDLAGKTVQAKLVSEKVESANSHFRNTATISSKYAVIKQCQIN